MLLQLYKFNIPKAAEQADAVEPVAQDERLVVCAALFEPCRHAAAHAAVRPEEQIRHIHVQQIRVRQDLARRADQSEAVRRQMRQRQDARAARLRREDRRGRIGKPALGQDSVFRYGRRSARQSRQLPSP